MFSLRKYTCHRRNKQQGKYTAASVRMVVVRWQNVTQETRSGTVDIITTRRIFRKKSGEGDGLLAKWILIDELNARHGRQGIKFVRGLALFGSSAPWEHISLRQQHAKQCDGQLALHSFHLHALARRLCHTLALTLK